MSAYIRFLLLLIAFVYTPSFAQQTLSIIGKVVDEKGNPIQLASIALHPLQHNTKSDETGSFTLHVPINMTTHPRQTTWEVMVNFVGKKVILKNTFGKNFKYLL